MKAFNDGIYQTGIATADLTGKAGYAIAVDTAHARQYVIGNALVVKSVGVLVDEGKAGQRISFKPFHSQGTATVIYGGSVSVGDFLTVDGNGKFITTTTNKDHIVGIALEAGASGEFHEALLQDYILNV